MGILKHFSNDLRTFLLVGKTRTKGTYGETVENDVAAVQVRGLVFPNSKPKPEDTGGVAAVPYVSSTHVLYIAEWTEVSERDTVVDGTEKYLVRQVEKVPDFGGGVSHLSVYLDRLK